ncbi:hypothetical protein RND71_006217 [Anisodus tanguticus]|uniref:Uncharacterized protein n=1 Tax=Anisodus tanguticus TaxID=243964 RepID=A0AAE1SSY1_9SOLA|nr:hypothetical protein RND71_006217 [Anisodus tanguticus]
MVKFMLMITAELENLTDLQPQGGCNADCFRYNFKLKCGKCGEITQKETYVSLGETVPPPLGKDHTHLVQKLLFIIIIVAVIRLDRIKSFVTAFSCRGFEPLDFVFRGKWKAESLKVTRFEGIDLSGDEFAEYDEKGECPVMISNPRATFIVVIASYAHLSFADV